MVMWCGSGGEKSIIAAEPSVQTGIRQFTGRHITLYTDLPDSTEIAELPRVFDLAVRQWVDFFQQPPDALDSWKVTACVMQAEQRFQDRQLIPPGLPDFLHGIQMGNRVWIREQPSAYYRRHLLLHEGTHAVMNHLFGRVGPVWYREGIAELLATHAYRDGVLRLQIFPQQKSDVEHWGRIKIVRDDVQRHGIRSIHQIIDLPTRAFLQSEAYAWTWALQSFLHHRPEYLSLRRSMLDAMSVSDRHVTETFARDYQARRRRLDLEWNAFVQHLDYGYDPTFETIQRTDEVVDLPDEVHTLELNVTQPWQSTGLRVAAGDTVDLAARGRYVVAREQRDGRWQPWPCEPQGVTIEYYQQRPLGQLLAAIVPDVIDGEEPLFDAVGIGRRGSLTSRAGGQLYLRINERADRLRDNAGKLVIKVRRRPQQDP